VVFVRRKPNQQSVQGKRGDAIADVENEDVDAILAEMKQVARSRPHDPYAEERLKVLEQPTIPGRIRSIIRRVETLDSDRQEATLADLGVTVIWYENHDEIAGIVEALEGLVER
jgi:hypothetical protein